MEKALMAENIRVRQIISSHMQADGLDIVLDLGRSRGSRLYDAKRDEYFIDLFGFFATNALGFNHPGLTSEEALSQLASAAIHKPSNSDIYSRELAEFVDAFAHLAKPDSMRYLFFIEGGALAVENALKASFDWKVRKNLNQGKAEQGYQVIHFRQSFHGRSGYTLSLTNTADPRKIQYYPKFDWPRITNPSCIFPLEGENLEQTKRREKEALDQIKEAISSNSDDIACLILEPIQGEGGDNHFRPEFHTALREICDENEILMIYDEVQTGFGATGKFWACEYYAAPDLLAFGKKSQVCGMMAGPRLDEVKENVFHVPSRINSTWGGNLSDMVRCRLILEVYQEEGLVDRARVKGEYLLNELQELQCEFPQKISNVRGKGLFCAFDLPDAETRNNLRKKLFEKRVLMLGCGVQSVRFRPALTIPEEDIQEGLARIRRAIQEV